MLGLDVIVKAILSLVVLLVVLGLVYALLPTAMKEYIDNTALGKIIPDFSIGKDKHESEFEIPKEMRDNIKKIDNILLSDKINWDEYDEGDIQIKDDERIIKRIDLDEFENHKLTIRKDYYIVENVNGQRAYYENDLTAIPCIIQTDDPNYMGGLLKKDISERSFVDSVIFLSKNEIEKDKEKYNFVGLTKDGNNVCFVYFYPTKMLPP